MNVNRLTVATARPPPLYILVQSDRTECSCGLSELLLKWTVVEIVV